MPLLDVSDQSFVALARQAVAADAAGPCALATWVPGLWLRPVSDRGAQGCLWQARAVTLTRSATVAWHGTAEVWLEGWHDATIVHFFVRLDPDPDTCPTAPRPQEVRRLRHALVGRWKQRSRMWRADVEAARTPGGPAIGGGAAELITSS